MTLRRRSKRTLTLKYQNHRYLQGFKVRKGTVVWASLQDREGNVIWECEVQA